MTTHEEVPRRRIAGRYRLDRILGRGAVGTVWAAYDEVLGRPVAIKEIELPAGMPEPEAEALRERTLREARAIAVLSHPNVITLYDIARDDGEPFVVMELMSARSLSEVLTDGPLTPMRAATVGAALAAALATAHAAGLTHRDVKPGNVLVAEDGRVKLTDFGIARNPADSTLTASGLVLGSPAFMAPEVASGTPVHPAADLWSLGATLFAAAEGSPPYDVAGDPVETVSAVVHGAVPVPRRPGPLGDVIRGLMVKEPSQRMPLQRVHELLHAVADERARVPFPAVTMGPSPFPPDTAGPPTRHRPEQPARPTRPAPAADTNGPGGAAPLAAAPGPLPWQRGSRIPGPVRSGRDRRRWPTRHVATALVLIASAVAAFALTRTAVGLPVLPRPQDAAATGSVATTATLSPPARQPPPTLAPREIVLDEDTGAGFSVAVPLDWSTFWQHTELRGFPGSVVRFVSEDGSSVLAISRVREFRPEGDPDTYLEAYLKAVSGAVGKLFPVARQEEDSGVEITYRTVQGGMEQTLLRTSYLRLRPADSELWMLRVTVPTKREEAGRAELFDRIVPTFTPVT